VSGLMNYLIQTADAMDGAAQACHSMIHLN
jgi:hypothetical protein